MKTFYEWMVERHPESIDEALLRDLANSKLARNLVAGAAIAAGGLGIGTGDASAALPRPTAAKGTQEDQDDDDFVAGDIDPDVEVAQEKARMLRDAGKLRYKTSLDAKTGVVTSRGSGHISGGKVVPSQNGIKKATEAPPRKFEPAKAKLPNLPSGAMQSKDFKGVE